MTIFLIVQMFSLEVRIQNGHLAKKDLYTNYKLELKEKRKY